MDLNHGGQPNFGKSLQNWFFQICWTKMAVIRFELTVWWVRTELEKLSKEMCCIRKISVLYINSTGWVKVPRRGPNNRKIRRQLQLHFFVTSQKSLWIKGNAAPILQLDFRWVPTENEQREADSIQRSCLLVVRASTKAGGFGLKTTAAFRDVVQANVGTGANLRCKRK